MNEEFQEWDIQNEKKNSEKETLLMFSFDVLNFSALEVPSP